MTLKSSGLLSHHASLLQPRSAHRPAPICSARRHESGGEEEPHNIRQIGDAVLKVSILGLASSVLAQPAGAWGYTWRPRRHHRRLDEWQREPDLGRYSPEAIAARERGRERLRQPHESKVETRGPLQQLGSWASSLKAKILQQEQAVALNRSDQQYSRAVSPYAGTSERGFSPVAAGGLLLLAIFLGRWLWGLLKMVNWSGGGKKKGRYVRDRGLGGKMVFIEDGREEAPRLLSNSNTFPASPASFSGRTESSDPWQAGIVRRQAEEQAPPWWSPPSTIYIDPAYKAQAREDAQAVVNRMINTKAASGQDYDLGSLVSLRQICGESGVTVNAKTQRDAIFRRAVEMAATCAEDQTNRLGGQPASKFVSGLACDLGIPEREAFKMVHGVVAAKARQTLITACANYRENENNDIMIQLLKLTGLMTALPLPDGSAEAELVAAGLQRAATLNERRAIFLTYGCMEERSAGLVAELMGFQPELVLPQLQDHIEKGRMGSRAAAN